MILKVISSSSKGNCYVLVGEKESLILEAGAPISEVWKVVGTTDVVGCVVSHQHSDHAKFLPRYWSYGLRIACNAETAEHYGLSGPAVKPNNKTYRFGEFTIIPFPVQHDVANNGYVIRHPDMGKMLFVTDTYVLPFRFSGIDHFLIEANYDDEALKRSREAGRISKAEMIRLMTTHMSFENCLQNLMCSHANKARSVILLHLSDRNSDARLFEERCRSTLAVPTFIASRGLEVDLTK